MATVTAKRPTKGIEYQHPAAFWFGVTAVTASAVLGSQADLPRESVARIRRIEGAVP